MCTLQTEMTGAQGAVRHSRECLQWQYQRQKQRQSQICDPTHSHTRENISPEPMQYT
jgi:hypothetical protein